MSNKARNNGDDVLDSVSPPTLEQATGTAVALRDVEEEEQAPVFFSGFTSHPKFQQSDLQIPYLRLAQGLTGEVQEGVARVGNWLLLGEDPTDTYTIIPVSEESGRIRVDKKQGGKRLCYSTDRITGHGDPGGDCETCPFSQWHDEHDAKSGEVRHVPPPCGETYRYVVFVEEADQLAVLTLKGSSLKFGRTLNTYIATKGLGNFAVTLGSKRIQGAMGSYAVPTIVPNNKVSKDTLEMARSFMS